MIYNEKVKVDHFRYLCFVFVFAILGCLFLAALWSPAGHGWPLGSLVCNSLCQFPIRFSGSGVVLVSIPDIRLLRFIGIKNARKNAK